MKGDFSRIRFNPAKQYTSVLEQQGRVSLDADSNEQCSINNYLRKNETVDVIGAYGAPEHDAGFSITASSNEILIGAGRYYVEGLVCENLEDNLPYLTQPHLLDPSVADSTLLAELAQQGDGGAIQVFLQVWQRIVTALDDPCLHEPALGQADTTVRLQTVWRVVASLVPPLASTQNTNSSSTNLATGLISARFGRTLLSAKQRLANSLNIKEISTTTNIQKLGLEKSQIENPISKMPVVITKNPTGTLPTPAPPPVPAPPPPDCCIAMYASKTTVSTGTMSASTAPGGSDCSCQPIPAAGYQGLENQLYRVEIHQPGDETTATFKWSRENASVVVAIKNVSGQTVTVDSLGPDDNLGFQANQWVEISDDHTLFGETPNQPGLLYQIQNVDPTVPSITLTTPVVPVDISRNPRLRRWDQTGALASASGVPLSVGTWLLLENGIQVSFSSGSYQSGDYWTIPARTATGLIDWPPCGGSGDSFQPPHSIVVYNAPLACIHWDANSQQPVVEDCRRLFAPLTELTAPIAPKALHVTRINWTNDALITADVWVANGLSITLDDAPTSAITSAEFVVTLESIFDPFPQGIRLPFSGALDFSQQRPSTFLRTYFVIDSTITITGSTINWTMPYLKAPALQQLTIQAINTGLLFGAAFGQYGRVRCRLLGNTISSGTGSTQLFLDGQSNGQPAANADGTTRMDLQLPSGSGRQSSNFDSWFYVAPTLLITSINVAYPALYAIVVNGIVTGVSAVPPNPTTGVIPPAVNPYVTIFTNYRALADTQLTLSLQDSTGAVTTFATIESPITIHAGELSATAAITVTGNPLTNAVPTTVTLTVEASIATAIGPIAAVPATFTLTGGLSQVIIL